MKTRTTLPITRNKAIEVMLSRLAGDMPDAELEKFINSVIDQPLYRVRIVTDDSDNDDDSVRMHLPEGCDFEPSNVVEAHMQQEIIKLIGHRNALLIDLADSLKREDLAVISEREECAKLADYGAEDEPYGHAKCRATLIASAIRERSNAKVLGVPDEYRAIRQNRPQEEATDEMIDAACAAVPDMYRVDAARAIEAALAVMPKWWMT